MNGKESNGQSPCCEGGGCCSSTSDNSRNRSTRWKSIVFTAVALLAGAVAAYSLFWRDDGSATSACCPAGSPALAIPIAEDHAFADLDDRLAEYELALVVLLHIGDVLSQQDSTAIEDVRAAMESGGSQLPVWTFTFGDPAFMEAIDRYNITTFPAVLVRGKHGTVALHRDEIRRDTILSIFEQKSTTLLPDPSGSGTK